MQTSYEAVTYWSLSNPPDCQCAADRALEMNTYVIQYLIHLLIFVSAKNEKPIKPLSCCQTFLCHLEWLSPAFVSFNLHYNIFPTALVDVLLVFRYKTTFSQTSFQIE